MGLSGVMVHLNPSQAAKHRFPLFSQNALRTYTRTYGKKIRLLKYPFAVNARDLKKSVVLGQFIKYVSFYEWVFKKICLKDHHHTKVVCRVIMLAKDLVISESVNSVLESR